MACAPELPAWDGSSTAALEALYSRWSATGSIADSLIALLAEPDQQNSATWLLKRCCDEGVALTAGQCTQLIDCLPSLVDWPARLHLLQCLPYIDVPDAHAATVTAYVLAQLEHDRTFVRAWAYGALHRLGQAHPAYTDTARERIAWALEHEAPSVTARLRRLGVQRC